MSDVLPLRRTPQVEEVRFKGAVSEGTAYKMAQSIAFINAYQQNLWQFNINGSYSSVTAPQYQIDGIITFNRPFEIIYCYIYSGEIIGSSGTTELDIKWKPRASGSYGSIFSTTPKFTTTAQANMACGNGDTATGFTAPVLAKTTFDAYDMLRFDMLGAMAGSPVGAGIGIFWRVL
jgi:hypothetical protein